MKPLQALAIVVTGAALASATPGVGQKRALAMLDQVDAGNWELRVRGAEGKVDKICIDGGRRLIQLRHQNLRCDQVIINDLKSEVTVQYSCGKQGYGRTHIRRETSGLLQIDSQGIASGFPFAFGAEARRAGDCPR